MQIGPYVLKGDDVQWTLYKRHEHGKTGKEVLRPIGFYGRLDQALMRLLHCELAASDLATIGEALARIQALERKLIKAARGGLEP